MSGDGSDIVRLIAWASGLSPARLRIALEGAGARRDWAERAGNAARRWSSGAPIEELVAEIEFFGRTFRWDRRSCLIRPYVACYVEDIVRTAGGTKPNVLDLGCGAGHVIVTLALELDGRFVGTDLSAEAIALAHENVTRHGASVELKVSDLFEDLAGERFDVVLANLPYELSGNGGVAPEEIAWEPEISLFDPGTDRLSLLLRFLRSVGDQLNTHGRVYVDLPEDLATQPDLPGRAIRAADGEPVGTVMAREEIEHAIGWFADWQRRHSLEPQRH